MNLLVRTDKLSVVEGRYLYREAPFSGYGFDIQKCKVSRRTRFHEGFPCETEVWDPLVPRILASCLEGPPDDATNFEASYYGGRPFLGLAYDFEDTSGVLLSEYRYDEHGQAEGNEWYVTGSLQGKVTRLSSAWKTERWYESGALESVWVDSAGATFAQDGRLKTLVLYEETDVASVLDMPTDVGSELYLTGEGVRDETIAMLRALENVVHLEVRHTGISSEGLRQLSTCTRLRRLETEGNARFTSADVRMLLERLPSCKWSGS